MLAINHKKIFYVFSALLTAVSLFFFMGYGLRPSVDFTGGTLMELKFASQVGENEISEKLKNLNLGQIEIKVGENQTYILRLKDIDQTTHQQIIQNLNPSKELRFNSIGPIAGKELKNKAILAVIISLILMMIYLAYAFRQISYASNGLITLVTLAFDIIVIAGVFSFLGKYYGVEVGLPFIAALLAITGYSINDRIIIFDRIRENLMKAEKEDFSKIIGASLKQTYARSFNTSFITVLVLLPVIFLSGETIKYFALTLVLGITLGTYSSIFLAAPLLLEFKKIFR